MEFLNKNKIIIISAVVFAIALYVYTAFIKSDSSASLNDASAQEIGGDVLKLNSSLQSVNLDQSLFDYSLYKNLQDFSTALVDQPTGRINPFDTIGRN